MTRRAAAFLKKEFVRKYRQLLSFFVAKMKKKSSESALFNSPRWSTGNRYFLGWPEGKNIAIFISLYICLRVLNLSPYDLWGSLFAG